MAVHSKEIGSIITEGEWIVNEIPSGLINSINTEYELSTDPVSGTVQVYLNGSLQSPGVGKDYTISGKTITFIKAPHTGSEILVSYIISS